MADYTTLKQQIAEDIRANGEGAITGPLMQENLLAIVDAMEIETFNGFITSETIPPRDITNQHIFLAIEPGTYEDFDLTVAAGDVWFVEREVGGSEWEKTNLAAGVKTIINTLDGEKQDVIPDLQQIRERADEGHTAYQLPQTGIPESDLSAGVVDKLTTAQEKATWNGKQDKVQRQGSVTKPVYVSQDGTFAECSTYAGGTRVNLNGNNMGATSADVYSPSSAGISGQVLRSTGDTPAWEGPDSTPMANSDRLVTSGGVRAAITTVNNDVTANARAIDSIEEKIPDAATSENQLADKSYVDNAVSTSTATFRGTSAPGLTEEQFMAWANALTKDKNDYIYWNTKDLAGNTVYKRYTYNGSMWMYEYSLNNSSFTSTEWAAIQSGITSSLVTQFRAKYDKPATGIPKTDLSAGVQSSLDKADTALQTESDPIFTQSPAHSITTSDISAWNAAAPQATTYTKTETDNAISAAILALGFTIVDGALCQIYNE